MSGFLKMTLLKCIVVRLILFITICESSPNPNRFFAFGTKGQEPASAEIQSPSLWGRTNYYEIADRLQSIQEETRKPPKEKLELNTSCGKITCDDVKDYPTEIIEHAFLKAFDNKTLPQPYVHNSLVSNIKFTNRIADSRSYPVEGHPNPLWIASLTSDVPSVEKSSSEIDESLLESSIMARILQKSARKTKNQRRHNYDQTSKRPNCDEQVKHTFPKEALGKNNKPVIVVNISSFKLQVPECIAEKFCRDDRTPETYVWLCDSKVIEVMTPIFDAIDQAVRFAPVHLTGGCDCNLVHSTTD